MTIIKRFAYWMNGTVVFSDAQMEFACDLPSNKIVCIDRSFESHEEGFYGYWMKAVSVTGNEVVKWKSLPNKNISSTFKMHLLLLGVSV